jgi:hypothetical protein
MREYGRPEQWPAYIKRQPPFDQCEPKDILHIMALHGYSLTFTAVRRRSWHIDKGQMSYMLASMHYKDPRYPGHTLPNVAYAILRKATEIADAHEGVYQDILTHAQLPQWLDHKRMSYF